MPGDPAQEHGDPSLNLIRGLFKGHKVRSGFSDFWDEPIEAIEEVLKERESR